MSHFFPEQPLLLYPSLASQFGVEEAVLLGIYHQFAQHHGHQDAEQNSYFIARRSEWQNLISFWDEDKLAAVTGSLVAQGAISAEFNANGSIRIMLSGSPAAPAPTEIPLAPAAADPEQVVAPTPAPVVTENTLQNRGPAPSFGGSTGWNRRQDDELETLFKQQEKRNQQLHEIEISWRPTATTVQMLAKHNIPESFMNDQLDDFIAYWLAQGQKKTSWDPAFIDHVKRRWVREQNRLGREARQAEQSNIEDQSERYQSASRAEKREKISGVVMDIKNLDWI